MFETSYDIVQIHFSSEDVFPLLRDARSAGIPVRIANCRNAPVEQPNPGVGSCDRRPSQRRFNDATTLIAVSEKAASKFFGFDWNLDPRVRLLPPCRDFSIFEKSVDRDSLRAALGIPNKAFVLGHIGRFHTQKNHHFLLRILENLVQREARVHLLLVGEGYLRQRIKELVVSKHLSSYVTFAGIREDVPSLMIGAMDIFVLPSLYEGLPGVGIEAQAAGLSCFLADTITTEVVIIKPLVHWASLSQPPAHWADAILACKAMPQTVSRSEALAIMERSPMSAEVVVAKLQEIYLEELKQSCVSKGAKEG